MDKLRIVSYNCRGIKSSIPLIGKICESNDIILLQETMLCSHNLDMIHTIHPDFYAGGCSSVNSEEFILTGRPHCGLAVLWRKTLGCVKTKKYSNRIYGIELTGSDKLVILNVYLPYDNNSFESLDNFRQILGEIHAIVQDGNANEVIVMGDFNADFKCRFGEELIYFAADNALQISDGMLRGYRSDLRMYYMFEYLRFEKRCSTLNIIAKLISFIC